MSGWRIGGFNEVRELGAGAQGRVVLAQHETSGAPVAIKYLARGDGDEKALEALRGEAVMLARVADPHVARLYRFVTSEHGAAIVMEAVNGVSLKAVLEEHGALSPEAALVVLKGSLLGLAAAHAVGVVHRDYKPANVVVQSDGLSKLVDFGVAALAGDQSRVGTPTYMAPEQWEGQPASPATDVYAATCVFFECVTGRRPFEARDRMALMRQHLMEGAPIDALPEPLRPLAAHGLAKDAAERPPGAHAFVTQLEAVASAAYGPDWQQRGVRGLAVAAAALAALFPLGAAALAPGVSGGAAGAASAQTAVATKTGLLATTGAKVTAAVAATAVVATTAGVAVYATAGADKSSRPAPPLVAIKLAALTQRLPGPVVINGAQYAEVHGLRNAQIEKRVNAALRVPLDEAIKMVRSSDQAGPGYCGPTGPPGGVKSTVRTGLSGPVLVSVAYDLNLDICAGAGHLPMSSIVTVDLRTGHQVTADDVWRPATLAAPASLVSRFRLTTVPFASCKRTAVSRADFYPGKGPDSYSSFVKISPFFLRDRVELIEGVHARDDNGTCGWGKSIGAYATTLDLIRPEFAALLPRAAPGPARS